MPTTVTKPLSEVRASLRDILDHVAETHSAVIVERYYKPVAVIVAFDDWQRMQTAQERQPVPA